MELSKLLKDVKNLNQYTTATEYVLNKCINIQLTMTTVLALKKVRSLEVEYFSKCDGNGLAFVVLERMLQLPSVKPWRLLGQEVVQLLQYWLEAVRKHLITHNMHWWTFLNSLLKFIEGIRSKEPTLINLIVEHTAECLLDLASNSSMDEMQRHQVLHHLNYSCASCSRELRMKLRERFQQYFVKLSTMMSSCGHLPSQLGIMETLMRWLVSRTDRAVRLAVSTQWFPEQLYGRKAVDVFLERRFVDFYQDARDFLNAHNNSRKDLVTSAVCRKLHVGDVAVINGPQSRLTWLDVNHATRSVTVSLELNILENIVSNKYKAYETLVITDDIVTCLQLYREKEILLSITTSEAPRLAPSSDCIQQDKCFITLGISSKSDIPALDAALRLAFRDKYRVLLDLNDLQESSSQDMSEASKKHEEEKSYVRPVIRRSIHSGLAVHVQKSLPWNSPSTASTTSLAQLHDKLVALPHYNFDKEAVRICAAPDLSMVREVSECDDRQSFSVSDNSIKRHYGICQSDSETVKRRTRDISPANKNDNSVSLMLIATLGTSDETVINDTLSRAKIKQGTDRVDLLDLLVEEAIENNKENECEHSQESIIDDTQFVKEVKSKKIPKTRKKCTVVSNTTTDDDNTDANETPFVNLRRTRSKNKLKSDKCKDVNITCDDQAVDAFFSQHFAENDVGDLVISPELAKKLNETTDESDCDEPNYIIDDLNRKFPVSEYDIIDCLNSIVDDVCSNLDKCTEIMSKEDNIDVNEINNLADGIGTDKMNDSNKVVKDKNDGKVRLKFKANKKKAQKKPAKKKNKDTDVQDEIIIENVNTNSPPANEMIAESAVKRRKRKLYSPKDKENEIDEVPTKPLRRESNNNETPIATCYRELEIARKTRSRSRRPIRKSRASTDPLPSPKTRRLNDVFDKLKEKVDNEEKITLVDTKCSKQDLNVYNFSSDSEDDDFKKKPVQKRGSATSMNTVRKRVKLTDKITDRNRESSTEGVKRNTRRRKAKETPKTKSQKVNVDKTIDLVDEIMREAPKEDLDSSFTKETARQNVKEPTPVLEAPVMETIPEIVIDDLETINVAKPQKFNSIKGFQKEKEVKRNVNKGKNKEKVIKKEKGLKKTKVGDDDVIGSGTDSPLPGLVVEKEQRKDDTNDSVDASMLKKFKKIYQTNDVDETQNLLSDIERFPSENFEYNDNIKERDVEVEENNISDGEKSINTIGKSPITAHCDFEEAPPDTDMLKENIKGRDLEMQDLEESMKEYFIKLTNEIQADVISRKSPVVPITRLSSEVISVYTSPSKVVPTVTLTKMSCRDQIPTVSLTRMSSSDVGSYMSPVKSVSKTPEVVIERIPSEELNKWLPLPSVFNKFKKETPKYNTRSFNKIIKTPKKDLKKKSVISPIKLSFDSENVINYLPKLRSQSKSAKSEMKILNKNKNILSQNSDKLTADESDSNKTVDIDKITVNDVKELVKRDSILKEITNTVPISEGSKSVSSVNEWFRSNVPNNISDKAGAVSMMKDSLEKVMESLQTTLLEIHQSTGRKLASMFVSTQERLNSLQEDLRETDRQTTAAMLELFAVRDRRSMEKMNEFKEDLKKRACEVIREDSKQKQMMVALLQEDVQATLDRIDSFQH